MNSSFELQWSRREIINKFRVTNQKGQQVSLFRNSSHQLHLRIFL